MKKMYALMLIAVLLCATTALADDWSCTVCGQSNSGKFCIECGAPMPPVDWTCPGCGQTNSGKFCTECGTPKPQAGAPAAQAAVNTPEPTPVPTPVPTAVPTTVPTAAPAANVRVGDVVTIGSFKEIDIQWQVLDVNGSNALVISRYALERMPFNGNSAGQTWENSKLRTWLNNDFMNAAFSSREAAAIQMTHVKEGTDQANPNMPSKRSGNDTDDLVFLLSYAEVMQYMPENEDRMCVPNDYAIGRGVNRSDRRYLDNDKTTWYWLRTPAYSNNILCVDWDGSIGSCYMHHDYGAVRPAMWIDMSAVK